MGPEKKFENRIKNFCRKNDIFYVKQFGGQVFTRSGMPIRTKSGVPDLLICCGSVFVGLELKSNSGTIRDDQIETLGEIERSGGVAICAKAKDEALLKNFLLTCKDSDTIDLTNFPQLQNWKETRERRRYEMENRGTTATDTETQTETKDETKRDGERSINTSRDQTTPGGKRRQ